MDIEEAGDIEKMAKTIVRRVPFEHVDISRIHFFRSYGSKSRARARIWSFPRIWQQALKMPAHYVIEVVSHHFDELSSDDKTRVIIHELMHIPKNFSGALVPHRGIHAHINARTVEVLFREYQKNSL